jgi:hypothetical protein
MSLVEAGRPTLRGPALRAIVRTSLRTSAPVEGRRVERLVGRQPRLSYPVFVLTHHPRPSIEMDGGTTFYGGLDVRIGGGPSTIREFLAVDLIDHMHIVMVLVVLGRAERLWNGLEGLEQCFDMESISSPSGITHLTLTRPVTGERTQGLDSTIRLRRRRHGEQLGGDGAPLANLSAGHLRTGSSAYQSGRSCRQGARLCHDGSLCRRASSAQNWIICGTPTSVNDTAASERRFGREYGSGLITSEPNGRSPCVTITSCRARFDVAPHSRGLRRPER